MSRWVSPRRAFAFPCGFAGPPGEAAGIVLAGRIGDWSRVPASERPAGLPLARFDEPIASSFRHMSGLHEKRAIVLRNAAEWQGQWRRITARQGDPPRLPDVDFSPEMLLVAAMGRRRSTGPDGRAPRRFLPTSFEGVKPSWPRTQRPRNQSHWGRVVTGPSK